MARALEVILILHMDHEQNASTSTVRVAGEHCLCLNALAAHVQLELVSRPWALGSLLPCGLQRADTGDNVVSCGLP